MASTPPQPDPPPPPAFNDSDLASIQGLGIAGFRKDHQELIFFTLPAGASAKTLVGHLLPKIASAQDVGGFNREFSAYRAAHGEDPKITACWVGLGASASGLEKLGVNLSELPPGAGHDAFVAGMASRATAIQDVGNSAPANWHNAFRTRGSVDALLLVAADEIGDLNEAVESLVDLITEHDGQVVFQERGETLPPPLTGHEHFGFKDGASQPAIQGYGPQTIGGEPPPVKAGEFVLGFADQTGPPPALSPVWQGGSFLIFRRLRQDVVAFRALAKAPVPAADPPVTSDSLAAKMIGRWPSGAPLAKYPNADPGPNHEDNDFGFLSDDVGTVVPTWAHIRKVNPRDETQPPPPDDPSTHRMIRRGIPFGLPLAPEATQDDGVERGLHFIALVADVARQFEFVQATWADNENFPGGAKPAQGGGYTPPSPGVPGDGPDPVIGEGNVGKALQLHQASGVRPIPLAGDLVTVTAGEYFFCPSVNGLKILTT